MASETMPLGVVLQRHEIDNKWQSHDWRAVAVIPGAAQLDDWRVLEEGAGWIRYHAGTLVLEIHSKETEGYKYNLGNAPPIVYLVLRYDDEAESGIVPFMLTACPFEAQAYLDGDEDLVEPVPMPPGVAEWLGAFVETHHVDEPKYKRQRKPHDSQNRRPTNGVANGHARR